MAFLVVPTLNFDTGLSIECYSEAGNFQTTKLFLILKEFP